MKASARGAAVILVAAVVLLPLALGPYGRFFGAEVLTWALYAMAFDLCFGVAGMLSFGHAAFFAFGAYGATFGVLYVVHSAWCSLAIALLAAFLLAAVVGFFAVRVVSHSFVIITITFSLVLFLLAQSEKRLTGGDDGLTFPPLALFGGAAPLSAPLVAYYTALGLCLLVYLALYRLVRSPLGLALFAVRDNERRARLVGYEVQSYRWLAFVLSGALAGLAGGLYAITHAQVTAQLFDISVSVDPVVWTLIGGAGTLLGPVIGAAVVLVLTNAISAYLVYTQIPIGLLLLVIVVFFPRGIVGVWRDRQARRAVA